MKDRILFVLIFIALAMGIYACLPDKKQPSQVLIPLYTTEEQQVELNARGKDIVVDGRGGKITDSVLIEIAKER